MAPIGFATAGPKAIIGRLVAADTIGGTSVGLDQPVEVKRDGPDAAVALDAEGKTRRGKPADVKSGLHWMLTKSPEGGFTLRRVSGWYEFEKPSAAPSTILSRRSAASNAPGSSVQKLPANVKPPSYEGELRIEANRRKEMSDKWDQMLLRRNGRLGVRVKFGDVVKESTDQASEVSGGKRKIEHPEDERVNDETGISKQKKKKAKQLRKEANAVDQAEEDDVPETANALLSLKHERGEAGWDFSDADEFSDDEQEKNDFEGGAIAGNEEVDEAAPSGDEDEGEDVEKELLSSHGKELEIIIQNFEEDNKADGPGDMSGEEEASEEENAQGDEDAATATKPQTAASAVPVLASTPASHASASTENGAIAKKTQTAASALPVPVSKLASSALASDEKVVTLEDSIDSKRRRVAQEHPEAAPSLSSGKAVSSSSRPAAAGKASTETAASSSSRPASTPAAQMPVAPKALAPVAVRAPPGAAVSSSLAGGVSDATSRACTASPAPAPVVQVSLREITPVAPGRSSATEASLASAAPTVPQAASAAPASAASTASQAPASAPASAAPRPPDSTMPTTHVTVTYKPVSAAPTAPASVSASAAPASAAPASAASASVAPTATDSTYAKLREETIQCLRQQGGRCTLKQLTAVMSLKNTKSERYKNLIQILKEVASLKMDPATNKPTLDLLREHRE